MATQKAPPKDSNRARGLAIRDDGMLYPATDNVLRQQNFRPYHGDPHAPLEERLAYLNGRFAPSATKGQVDAELGAFNIATATKEELIEFIENEYGTRLDGRKPIDKLRNEAILLVQNGGK